MAGAWVQAQGTNTVVVGSNTSIAITTLHNLAAGNTLIVGVRTGDTTGGGYACTDGTHAFNVDLNPPADANLGSLAIFSYYYPSGLASGATITISWTPITLDAMASAHELSGLFTASWTDKTATANAAAAGTTPSSGATATLSQAAEIAIGIVGYYQTGSTGTTLTQAGWTAITGASAQVASTYEEGVLLAYKVLAATTAVTFAPTLSISATYAQAGVVTYKATTVPGAPTIGAASVSGISGTASVTFTPPASNGGSAITGYTVTSTPSSITGTGAGSPISVSSLANGTSYTFTVHATNSVGNSAESSASNSVTPYVPPIYRTINPS